MDRNISASPSSPSAYTSIAMLKGHLEICRFDHWIKNAFVLPGIVVALGVFPQRFSVSLIGPILVGLLATGLIASSNYVINEVLDAPSDLAHPKKRFRPVPSGRVNVPLAYVQWIALMLVGLKLAATLSWQFAAVLFSLWVMGCLYNIRPVRTKDVPYVDVLSESINNPIRMLAGWLIVNPPFSISIALLLAYWMVGCYFMAIKRFAEMRDISKHVTAAHYRKSFAFYNERNLLVSIMFYASASMLFFGAFVMRYRMELILTFPLVALVMAVYLNLAFNEDGAAQAPEELYREPSLMISVLLCAAAMGILMFVRIPMLASFFAQSMPN